MKIKELLNQPEGRKIEFKSALPSHADLNKTIVAFANDAGGELYIGIKDKPSEVVGVPESDLIQIEEQISSSIHDNCAPIILRHISQGSEYEGVYRKDRWEYPVVAIREVIRNAVIHRDYSLRGKDIKVAVFDDKIEITSPGKLLPTIDFNEMEAGQSDIRNIVLAPVFKKLGIIEQWGNGLQLIAGALKKYPEIEMQWSEPGLSFRVTFLKTGYERLRSVTNENSQLSDDYGRLRTITDDYGQLEPEARKILLYLLDGQKISRKEAAKLLNIGKTKTFEILSGLLEKDLIERRGQGRSTHYCLIKKGNGHVL